MRTRNPLVVFSHLAWDFVYQRPQHILSRLARSRRVIFIEEPAFTTGQASWEYSRPLDGLLVCKPHTPVDAGGFASAQVATLTQMVRGLLEEQEICGFVAWLYTPMALPIARALRPNAVIYDCMDELSAFNGAPKGLRDNERQLLRWADAVFTGGPSLYRAKIGLHPNLHCLPSSVDVAHFRAARHLTEPADQSGLAHPRLGYYGVIDERLDLGLLHALGEAHPEWQIVMIGPIAKIDQASLPSLPNIHYLGMRPYEQLPSYLSGWDVCLLPFALNEATRFISPTKTLEYMAAELPIVSTPITDVEVPYSDTVRIGRSHPEFIRACEMALAESANEAAARRKKMRDTLSRTSWDSTVAAMNELIEQALASRRQVPNNIASSRQDWKSLAV